MALNEPEPFKVTIARNALSWVKMTLLPDFKEITDSYREEYGIEVYPSVSIKRQEQIYEFNGCEFGFFGLDDPKKLHGRKQHITWLNEVMEIDKASFNQLEMRTIWFMINDYNPSDDSHWVFDLEKRPDCVTILSTILDNPYIEEAIRRKVYSYEPTEENVRNGTADAYMWDVYGLGKKAKLQGAVFTNWDVVNYIPEDAKKWGTGLDFGFTNDPSALIDLYTYNSEIYLDEQFYEKGLTNGDISSRMDLLNVSKLLPLVADSSEPKSIEEISRLGYSNIQGVEKGTDSINFGIDIMKSFKIHITKRSINLENEFRKYKWSEDKNGRSLNKPIDDFNHGIDAARYIVMTVLKKQHETTLYPLGTIS